jgi:hypothetical protein
MAFVLLALPCVAQDRPATSGTTTITAEQRRHLSAKLERIASIVEAANTTSALTANRRQWLRETLYAMPAAQVARVQTAGDADAITASIMSAKRMRAKDLGDASSDLTYRPFAPCRFIDTRNVGGKINGLRTFDLAADGSVYGGSAACDPVTLLGLLNEDAIAALALNITIVDTSTAVAPGFATARPVGAVLLTALVNWTTASTAFQLGNAAIVTTDQSGALTELEILTSGAVHAIVDLSGAFVAPAATPLDCVPSSDVAILAAGAAGSVMAGCGALTLTGGGCRWSADDGTKLVESNSPAGNAWYCFGANNSGVTSSLFANAICCRTPGR